MMVNDGLEFERKRLLTVVRQYRGIYLKSVIFSVNIAPSGGYLSLPTPSPDISTHWTATICV